MKSTRCSCQIFMKFEFSVQIFGKKPLKYKISWNSVQWEPSCYVRTDGQTRRSLQLFFAATLQRRLVKTNDGCARRKAYRGNWGKTPLALSLGTRREWLISLWCRPLQSDTINLLRTEWDRMHNTVRTSYCLLHASTSDGKQRGMNGWTCSIPFSVRDNGHSWFSAFSRHLTFTRIMSTIVDIPHR